MERHLILASEAMREYGNKIRSNVRKRKRNYWLPMYFSVVSENVGYCLCLEKKHAVGCDEEH